jgi:hypothetical protein
VHIAEQPECPYPDERGAGAAGDRREPQLPVAEHVGPGELDLHAFGYINAQVAEQRDGGDLDYLVADDDLPQIDVDVAEQSAGAERAGQSPAAYSVSAVPTRPLNSLNGSRPSPAARCSASTTASRSDYETGSMSLLSMGSAPLCAVMPSSAA